MGVSKDTNPDELKKAYRKLSKEHHPDRGGNEDKFKEVAEAYSVLSDDNKKAQYDGRRENPFAGGGNPFDGFSGGDPFEMFKEFFEGRSQRRPQQHQPRGTDINMRVDVTLEDVFFGYKKTVKYNRQTTCGTCRGNGGERERCNYCGGKGIIEQVQGNSFFRQVVHQPCPHCNGEGSRLTFKCTDCKGQKYKLKEEKLEFAVPKGTDEGQFFRFLRKGNEVANGKPGNLLVTFRILPHDKFFKNGLDLVTDITMNPVDLMLGKKILINHFEGSIKIDIPPLIEPGKALKADKKGFYSVTGEKGNLFININLEIPKKLNGEEVALLERLKMSENFMYKT